MASLKSLMLTNWSQSAILLSGLKVGSSSRTSVTIRGSISEQSACPADHCSPFYQNVRVLKTNLDIHLSPLAQQYHGICIAETWLHNNILNSELLRLYFILRCDRDRAASPESIDGAVLISIKDPLCAEPIYHSFGSPYDCVVLRVFNLCPLSLPPHLYKALFDS